jgi:Kef-type K+ transport system membrane component KefB
MSLQTADLAHILIALGVLMVAAHVVGSLFVRYRQPRAIGEVVGGLLLGPTVLGYYWPAAQAWLFPGDSATSTVVAAVAQLGLLLLLFVTGTEIRRVYQRREQRTVMSVFVAGMVIPFAAGIGILQLADETSHWGPNGNSTSFLLVFSIAMAVTSIPVISRIMHDLGILDTDFARIVLGVAVLEDLVLYVILAVAIGYAGAPGAALFGLPGQLGISGGSNGDLAYHVLVTLLFLGLFLGFGARLYRWIGGLRVNLIQNASPVGHQLAFILAATIAALGLGIEAFFGALVAGIVVGSTEPQPSDATRAVTSFALAFFIPIYFAIIGLGLDLRNGFSFSFFATFLVAACAIKWASVYLGARVAGESRVSSTNLAVAMNARGGPGIVVASTAYAAGIIDQPFYAVLVLLAIVTSLLAGAWLERVPRDRLLVRSEEAEAPGTTQVTARA